jgi:HK97 family phage major capsid protein
MKFEKYLEEKGIKSVDGLSAEELAGHMNEFNALIQAALEAAIEAKASKEDIDAMKSEVLKAQNDQAKQLNEVLKEHGLAIKRFAAPAEGEKNESFGEQIRKSLELNKDNLAALKSSGKSGAEKAGFEFEVKVPGDMTIAGNVSGGNIPVEDRIEGLSIVPTRRVRLLDVMGQRSTTSNVVSWVDQANKDGAAGQTAEAAAKNQIDFDLVVVSEAVKKTTAYIKVSTEMLDDIDYIQSEIQNELMRELLKAVEVQAYSGDGIGQNHNGIRTVASAFAAGSFALAIDNANEVDVLVVAMNQIEIAQEGEVANYVFMHPTDVAALKMQKLSSTDKRYVERLMQVGSTLLVDGVPIIKTTLVTEGEYLIGAFDKSILVTRAGMKIDIGLDGNDFTENMRTILAEWRGLTLVKTNDQTAFVAGVFATDKAALETA